MKSYTITEASVMCNYKRRHDFINELMKLEVFDRIPEDCFNKGSVTVHNNFRKKYKRNIKVWFDEREVVDRSKTYRYQLKITQEGIEYLKYLLNPKCTIFETHEQMTFDMIC